MLKVGGTINIIIAVGHIIGLFWAKQMFEITGVGKEMEQLAQIHHLLPTLLTIFAAIVFLIFGLYGLSASGAIKKLPFLKVGIFGIALMYLLRGIGEQAYNLFYGTTTSSETIQSIVSIFIGWLEKMERIDFRNLPQTGAIVTSLHFKRLTTVILEISP